MRKKAKREVVGYRVKDPRDGLYAYWCNRGGPGRWEDPNEHAWSDRLPVGGKPKPMPVEHARLMIKRLVTHYEYERAGLGLIRVTRPVRR
jgi:hypothetical protein